jgi:arylsulfatase A-like enzyme
MRRRTFLSSLASSALAQRADRPNVVFLLTDDQRWDSLGCMGNRIVRTPHIDRLAEQGVTFENHFVTTAICMTSRASIFTGQWARRHRVNEFATNFTEEQFARIYPVLMRAAGYHTGFIGKWGVGSIMPSARFDYWKGFPGQGKYFPNGEPGKHLTELMGDQALEFLGATPRDKNFCLSISFKAAHVQDEDPRQFLPSPATAHTYDGVTIPVPKTADPKYIAMFPPEIQRSENRRRWAVRFSTPELYQTSVKSYYRLITEVDTVVERIRQQLDLMGVSDNTVIVYSGDNGFYLAEHGLAGKWFPHEESIRVPMIVYDPRWKSAVRGSRRTEMTLNVDIAPTLLEFARIAPPVEMQGRSLLPLAESRSTERRRELFYEHAFSANGWIPPSEGIRTERWKYARYYTTSPVFEELYDLAADPLEERNLAASAAHSGQLDRLRRRRETWIRALDSWDGRSPWRDPA